MLVAKEPAPHVRQSSVSCTGSAGETTSFDNLSSSLLDTRDEGLGVPFVSDEIESILSLYGGPSEIRGHSGRVISPNDDLFDISNSGTSPFSNLPDSPIVVKSGHSCKVALREVFGVSSTDKSVGVSGVTDDEGSYVSAGIIVDGSALRNEDFGVILKKVTTLLTFASGLGSDQESGINVSES